MANVCLIRQGFFPQDQRLTKAVDALVGAGHRVDVICAGRPGQARAERAGGAFIHRLPIPRRRGSPVRYVLQYAAFLVGATLTAAALRLRRRYDLVQVNSLPDPLVFAAIVPRIFGARVLLDLQECMPEFFAMKYGLAPEHPGVRLLAHAERASIAFADRVLTCTDQMRARFVERGAPADKIDVILLSSDEALFDPQRAVRAPREPGTFVLTFHGTLEESFGPDTVVRAVALLKDELPGLRLKIFGDGSFKPALRSLIAELGIGDRVWLAGGFVPLPELVSAIASADAGVVPTKRSAFRDLTHSTKMFDLIAMGRPAIVARTASVEAYFDASCFQLFDSGDPRDLARAISELHADPGLGVRLVDGAGRRSEPYRWVHQRRRYLEIVEQLVRRERAPALVSSRGEDA